VSQSADTKSFYEIATELAQGYVRNQRSYSKRLGDPPSPDRRSFKKLHRIKPPARYRPNHDEPYRSELDMTRDDWLAVHYFMRARDQLGLAELSDKVRARQQARLPELIAYADDRRLDPALMNRWAKRPKRKPGEPLTFGSDMAATGELELTAPATRKPDPPATSKPPAESLDTLEAQLRASVEQLRGDARAA
jgi:hypothetical protein